MKPSIETITLATTEVWTLFERTDKPSDRWRRLRLVRNRKTRGRNVFSFGWNGERLSRDETTAILAERYPTLMRSVIDILKRTDRKPDLASLKAAMVAAHPDHGGNSAAFIEAHERYVAMRERQARSSSRQ
jgi:hypothetical protein